MGEIIKTGGNDKDKIKADIQKNLKKIDMKTFIKNSLENGDYSFFDTTKKEVVGVALATLSELEIKMGKVLKNYEKLGVDPKKLRKWTDGDVVFKTGKEIKIGNYILNREKRIKSIEDRGETEMIDDFTEALLDYWDLFTKEDGKLMDEVDKAMEETEKKNATSKIQAVTSNKDSTEKTHPYEVKKNKDGISTVKFSDNVDRIRVDEVLKMKDEDGSPIYKDGDKIYIDYSEKKSGIFSVTNMLKRAGIPKLEDKKYRLKLGVDSKGNNTLCFVGSNGKTTNVRGLIAGGVKIHITPARVDRGKIDKNIQNKKIEEKAKTRGYADILKDGFPSEISTELNLSEQENRKMMIGMDKLVESAMQQLRGYQMGGNALNEDEPFSSSIDDYHGRLIEAHTTSEDGEDLSPDVITEANLKLFLGNDLGERVYSNIDSIMGVGGHLTEFIQFLKNRRNKFKAKMKIDNPEIFESYVDGLDINFGSKENAEFMKKQLDRELENIANKIKSGKISMPESAEPFSLNGAWTNHFIEFETGGSTVDENILNYDADGKLISGDGIAVDGVDLGRLKEIVDHGFDDTNTKLIRDYLNQKRGEVYKNAVKDKINNEIKGNNNELIITDYIFSNNEKIKKPGFMKDKFDSKNINFDNIKIWIGGARKIIENVADDASINTEENAKIEIVEDWIKKGMDLMAENITSTDLSLISAKNKESVDDYITSRCVKEGKDKSDLTKEEKLSMMSDYIILYGPVLNGDDENYKNFVDKVNDYNGIAGNIFKTISTFEHESGDADELENLLGDGTEGRVDRAIELIGSRLYNIEKQNSSYELKSKALINFYIELQKSVINDGSTSSSYDQNASTVMRAVGQKVFEKIKGYINLKQENNKGSMNKSMAEDLDRLSQIMRDKDSELINYSQQTEVTSNYGINNKFQDYNTARKIKEFILFGNGGTFDQKKDKLKDHECDTGNNIKSKLDSILPLGNNLKISDIFGSLDGFKTDSDKTIFDIEYKDLNTKQKILLSTFDRLTKRFQTQDDILSMLGTTSDGKPDVSKLMNALLEVQGETTNSLMSRWSDDISSDGLGGGVFQNAFDEYKDMNGSDGRWDLKDETRDKVKEKTEMIGTIVVAVVVTAVVTVLTAGGGTPGTIAGRTALFAEAGFSGAMVDGVIMGTVMKLEGLAMGHGYDTYLEGVTDVVSEGIMMGAIGGLSLGLGNIIGTSTRVLLKLAKTGVNLTSSTLMFTGGMDIKQKLLTDNGMSAAEFINAMVEGLVLAVAMGGLHKGGDKNPLNRIKKVGLEKMKVKTDEFIKKLEGNNKRTTKENNALEKLKKAKIKIENAIEERTPQKEKKLEQKDNINENIKDRLAKNKEYVDEKIFTEEGVNINGDNYKIVYEENMTQNSNRKGVRKFKKNGETLKSVKGNKGVLPDNAGGKGIGREYNNLLRGKISEVSEFTSKKRGKYESKSKDIVDALVRDNTLKYEELPESIRNRKETIPEYDAQGNAIGAYKKAVVEMQKFLKEEGLYKLSIDGKVGQGTEIAIGDYWTVKTSEKLTKTIEPLDRIDVKSKPKDALSTIKKALSDFIKLKNISKSSVSEGLKTKIDNLGVKIKQAYLKYKLRGFKSGDELVVENKNGKLSEIKVSNYEIKNGEIILKFMKTKSVIIDVKFNIKDIKTIKLKNQAKGVEIIELTEESIVLEKVEKKQNNEVEKKYPRQKDQELVQQKELATEIKDIELKRFDDGFKMSPDYIKRSQEGRIFFKKWIDQTNNITKNNFIDMLKGMHKLSAYKGSKMGEIGKLRDSEVFGGKRERADIYTKKILKKFGFKPEIKIDSKGRVIYAKPQEFSEVFDRAAQTLQKIKDITDNATGKHNGELVELLSDYHYDMAFARPFGNVNNSLFMNQINFFLKANGLSPIKHGHLDHIAPRIQKSQYRAIFKANIKNELPLSSEGMRLEMSEKGVSVPNAERVISNNKKSWNEFNHSDYFIERIKTSEYSEGESNNTLIDRYQISETKAPNQKNRMGQKNGERVEKSISKGGVLWTKKGNYKNGKMDGYWEEAYSHKDGTKGIMSGEYKNGEMTGTWTRERLFNGKNISEHTEFRKGKAEHERIDNDINTAA